jgi:putative ATP-grasp target RiPP
MAPPTAQSHKPWAMRLVTDRLPVGPPTYANVELDAATQTARYTDAAGQVVEMGKHGTQKNWGRWQRSTTARPTPYVAQYEHLPQQQQDLAIAEARHGLGGVLNNLSGARYVNHPSAVARAEFSGGLSREAARETACGGRAGENRWTRLLVRPSLTEVGRSTRPDEVHLMTVQATAASVNRPFPAHVMTSSDVRNPKSGSST